MNKVKSNPIKKMLIVRFNAGRRIFSVEIVKFCPVLSGLFGLNSSKLYSVLNQLLLNFSVSLSDAVGDAPVFGYESAPKTK